MKRFFFILFLTISSLALAKESEPDKSHSDVLAGFVEAPSKNGIGPDIDLIVSSKVISSANNQVRIKGTRLLQVHTYTEKSKSQFVRAEELCGFFKDYFSNTEIATRGAETSRFNALDVEVMCPILIFREGKFEVFPVEGCSKSPDAAHVENLQTALAPILKDKLIERCQAKLANRDSYFRYVTALWQIRPGDPRCVGCETPCPYGNQLEPVDHGVNLEAEYESSCAEGEGGDTFRFRLSWRDGKFVVTKKSKTTN